MAAIETLTSEQNMPANGSAEDPGLVALSRAAAQFKLSVDVGQLAHQI